MKASLLPGLVGAALAMTAWPSHAGLLDQLSAADRRKVEAGQQVMLTQSLDGYPWPRVKVYQMVDARPGEVTAVFCDYANARSFVPNCLQSKISREVDARTTEVDYVIDVPILSDEAYTARNTISRGAVADSFIVDWRVLRASSILESQGSLQVEPAAQGGSILCYTNLVKPSSAAAGLLKGIALGQMRDTVQAIVTQTEKRRARPTEMASAMDRVDKAVE